MIIEKHSVPTYTADGANMSKFRAIFDSLCEWDSVAEVSTQNVKYTYGCFTFDINFYDSTYSVDLLYGGTTVDLSGYRNWFNVQIIKTATSVGMLIFNGTQNATIPADNSNAGVHKVVLTKNLNINTGSEEKGIVYAVGTGTAGQINLQVVADSNAAIATSTTVNIKSNSSVTILQPAASTSYTGYCPNVYVPALQTCASSNVKCTVNGATYYIMGGSLYLLDD